MIRKVLLILVLFSFCISISYLSTTIEKSITSLQDLVYYELDRDNFAMCYRRLNATHQVGCSSKRSGSVGIVFYVKNEDDLNWLMLDSPQQNYVVVMVGRMFQSNVSAILMGSSKIAGIVIMVENERDRPDSFSPDVHCPNDHYGLYWNDDQYSGCKKTVWNPYGNGMISMDIPFPIVIVSNASDEKFILRNCFQKFNSHRIDSDVPKCALEIRDVMNAAKDTPTCIRRNNLQSIVTISNKFYCSPMRSLIVFAYLNHVSKTENLNSGSVTIVAARMDSFSLFEDRFLGYETVALGFVTLHAVAEVLGRLRRSHVLDTSSVRPVMFALFAGEAFDYIGSSRMVYDIEQRDFLPLTPESIGTFIELGQVELNNYTDYLWIHTDPVSSSKSQDIRNRVDSLASVITSIGSDVGLSIKRTTQGSPLPPSSMHEFLKSPKTSIAGILLSTHEKEFSNRYYNSFFDNANSTGPETYNDITPTVQHIQMIATTVARTVYSLLFGRTDIHNIHASNITVANLLYCFTGNADCELFNSTIDADRADRLNLFHKSYVSRFFGDVPIVVSQQHRFLLAHFLGDAVDGISTSEECDNQHNESESYAYVFANGPLNEEDGSRKPVCVRSTASAVTVSSPAFTISDYDWSSERYSSWTKSTYDHGAISVRIFLLPSRRQEIIVLCIGSVSFVLFLILVYLIQRKSSTLFGSTG